jgi:predicted DNA-binding protein (MmcQ/YjbR family)
MDPETFRALCLQKPGASECFPFDEDTLVFKVGTRMFALMSLEKTPVSANLKCDPDRALDLRDQYDAVQPGYHMSKKHWNTIQLEGDLPDRLLRELITHSYDLVLQSLTRKERLAITDPDKK